MRRILFCNSVYINSYSKSDCEQILSMSDILILCECYELEGWLYNDSSVLCHQNSNKIYLWKVLDWFNCGEIYKPALTCRNLGFLNISISLHTSVHVIKWLFKSKTALKRTTFVQYTSYVYSMYIWNISIFISISFKDIFVWEVCESLWIFVRKVCESLWISCL